MTTAFYRVGLISATNGDKTITGQGTTWTLGANKVETGDVFVFNNKIYEIEYVDSDTQIRLFEPFDDADVTNAAYMIMRNATLNISSRIAAQVAIAINQKQRQLNEFNAFLTSTDATVDMTDTTGNVIAVIPIPTLKQTIVDLVNDASNIRATVDEAIQARDEAQAVESSVQTMKTAIEAVQTDVNNMRVTVESDATQVAHDAAQVATDKAAVAADRATATAAAGTATTKAGEASTSATAAATSETNTAASETAAAGSASTASTNAASTAADRTAVETAHTSVTTMRDEVAALRLQSEGDAATAAQEAAAAATSNSQAAQHSTDAEAFKDTAQAEALKAAASETAAAESARLAQAAIVPMRNEAEMWEMINRNKAKYAASQFVNMGQHYVGSSWQPINDGLWTDTTAPNVLSLGKHDTPTPVGSSATPYPVTTVAGFISEILHIQTGADQNTILFPEAPNGTVIFDSSGDARGTSNANLDLLNEVDPKYGNAAKDHGGKNEAVARAFEGNCINGDFRLGDTGWGVPSSGAISSEGLTWNNTTQISHFLTQTEEFATVGEEFTVTIVIENLSGSFGFSFSDGSSPQLLGNGTHVIKGTSTTVNKLYVRLYPNSSGTLKMWSTQRSTEEVVITPHDVFGMEYWLEEVSLANPDVFDCGMVQSKAADSNGVTTSASSRPQTYHAAFKGDTTTGHTSVDFFAATFEEQCKLAAKDSNNLFRLNDGRIVQWRGRQRTIRGTGNGSFDRDAQSYSPDNRSRYGLTLGRGNSSPQGFNNAIPDYGIAYWTPTNGTTNWNVDNPNRGVYQASGGYGGAPYGGMFGLCFFQIWGERICLNQGAYHPSLNPMGTAKTVIAGVGWLTWHHSGNDKLNSASDCFKPWDGTGWGVGGGDIASGQNSSTTSGGWRPDGRYYDAVYAGGQGGVIDYRVSAYDMGAPEEAAKIFQKVVNGSYRGKEELKRTQVFAGAAGGTTDGSWGVYYADSMPSLGRFIVNVKSLMEPTDVGIGSMVSVVDASSRVLTGVCYSISGDSVDCWVRSVDSGFTRGYSGSDHSGWHLVIESNSGVYVSGDFSMVDVVGNPANILATPQLANGWIGGWVPIIPNAVRTVKLTRKSLGTAIGDVLTNDFGSTWLTTNRTLTATTNIVENYAAPTDRVTLFYYTAFAKQTKESVNKEVLNGACGIGSVKQLGVYLANFGALLSESLMGKIITSSNTSSAITGELSVLEAPIRAHEGKLGTGDSRPLIHSPVSLGVPNNNSPAVKTLWHQASTNQQATLNFLWNEMVWYNYTTDAFTDISMAAGVNSTVGSKIHITTGDFKGTYLHEKSYSTRTWQALSDEGTFFKKNGDIVGAGDAVVAHGVCATHGGWGDDSRVRIIDGTGTYVNLNGDTCLYGSAELAIPYGYTKNRARAGSQTAGVDL